MDKNESFKIYLKYLIYFAPFVMVAIVWMFKSGIFYYDRPKPGPEIISDMDRRSRLHPQGAEKYKLLKNKVNSEINYINKNKYPYSMIEFEKADSAFRNPLESNNFVIAHGKNRFEVFCSHCHGRSAIGDGPIVTQTNLDTASGEEGYPEPANLIETRYSDARIFHVISAGQNLMFPLAGRIPEKSRWAIVHYIRHLQSKSN